MTPAQIIIFQRAAADAIERSAGILRKAFFLLAWPAVSARLLA